MRMSATPAGLTLAIALLGTAVVPGAAAEATFSATVPATETASSATVHATETASSAEVPATEAALPATAPTAEPDALTAIVDLRQQWVDALNRDDLFTALDTYGAGAVVLPEHGSPMLGTAGIGSWLHRWNAGVDVDYDLSARLVRVDRRYAVEEWVARVTVTPRSEDRLAIGGDVFQFEQGGVRVYRRDAAGRWRIDRETWSADPPAMLRYAACAVDNPAIGTC